MAFLLSSTNLVIELGIVISLFLSWQFVVGEYVGGLLLILFMWILVKMTLPSSLEGAAREHATQAEGESTEMEEANASFIERIQTREAWQKVAKTYAMEWGMVWKDVSVGFTVAGIIAAFVPPSFFQTLFIGSGSSDPAFWQVLSQAAVGPVAAFFTFIGSMGNIPLAAVLFSNGVSFAGVMAFIFSDLVVFPVLRIQAEYYGWKMAAYILGIFLVILIASAVTMHYGFALFDALPSAESAQSITDRSFFKINYSFFLNLAFIGVSGAFFGWSFKGERGAGSDRSVTEWVLLTLSVICYLWLVGGLVVKFFVL